MQTLYKRVGLALLAALWCSSAAWAQKSDADDEQYKTITTFGVTSNTNSGVLGGFSFRRQRLLEGTLLGRPQYRYLSIELVNVKHPKELQSSNGYGSRYIEGKENYLFVLRPQYGREIRLFDRIADEGIAVSAILAAGPSLGIIKPYYLTVQSANSTRTVPASQVNGLTTSQGESVTGGGGILTGIGESTFTFGAHIKAALSFELSAFRNNTTGVEIGFLAEAFPQKIVIIPNYGPGNREDGNRSFFTSGYVTLFFGSKK